MHFRAVLKIVGILFLLFSFTLLAPLTISYFSKDGSFIVFLSSFLLIAMTGVLIWFPVRKNRQALRARDGFLTVAAFWMSLALAGSMPFFLSPDLHISFTNSFFESMSGLTTTGATILTGIDDLPLSIKYYRQQLQWLGGMGIIVLAVAVMPMLGIGGMELYRAEMPGLNKDSKLTPRIKETAKALWYIYLGLTVVCATAYWAAGMSVFDAITHSYATVAIGGFSTHDDSFGAFDSVGIMYVGVIFMILAGMNFALHFRAIHKLNYRVYFNDNELKVYLCILLVATVLVCTVLVFGDQFESTIESIHHGIFQVVSTATTSGFTTTNFSTWPLFLPALLLAVSIVGGCTGSTAGGLKVVRVMLLYKQGRRELYQLIHPNALLLIRLNNVPLEDRVVHSVWGFFSLYAVSFVVLSLVMLGTGVDLVTAYSTVTACINNLGPALGDAALNYADLGNASKWVLAFTMLIGRLELLTILILLFPSYWMD